MSPETRVYVLAAVLAVVCVIAALVLLGMKIEMSFQRTINNARAMRLDSQTQAIEDLTDAAVAQQQIIEQQQIAIRGLQSLAVISSKMLLRLHNLHSDDLQ